MNNTTHIVGGNFREIDGGLSRGMKKMFSYGVFLFILFILIRLWGSLSGRNRFLLLVLLFAIPFSIQKYKFKNKYSP